MSKIKAGAAFALVIVVSLRSVASGVSAPVTSLGIAILCPVATSNSRLLRIGKARQLRAHRQGEGRQAPARASPIRAREARVPPGPLHRREQIGRASCRDRVCQYV